MKFRAFWNRLLLLTRRHSVEVELNDEIRSHLEMAEDDFQRNGMSADEARRAALRNFGGVDRTKEQYRDRYRFGTIESVVQDLVYAVRGLLRSPGFTAGAVAVLGLGIGANLALVQLFEAATVYRYSIPDAPRFVRLSRTSRNDPGGISRTFPSAAVEFYRANSSAFAALIAEDSSFTVTVDGTAERRSTFVSENYFNVVGIRPALGRLFDQTDTRSDAPPVALLDYQYWKDQLGSDPRVLGRIIHVNDAAVQIVGILRDDFHGLSQQTDLWFTENSRRLLIPGNPVGQSHFFAKLKPGASITGSVAELTSLTKELAHEEPAFFTEDDHIQGDILQESLVHFLLTVSPAIFIFMGTFFLVLLAACAHIGNMLLVCGLARQREFAIRLAIGASRSRIIRQLVTENALLALLGTVTGLLVAANATRIFVALGTSGPPLDASIHWETLVACVAMTFISVFAFGLPSAREITRSGFQFSQMRSRFVTHQVTASCMLLVITGLFVTRRILDASSDLLFDYRNIVIVDPQLYNKESSVDVAQRRLTALAERLKGVPGVEKVTVATAVPLRGRIVDNFPQYPRIQRSAVAPSFFDALGMPVLRGRTFLPGEQDSVIASESAARTLWPNDDPLGQTWKVAGQNRTVVGVVRDSWSADLNPAVVEAYLPISNIDVERCLVILRTYGDPSPVVGTIQRTSAQLKETVQVTAMSAVRDAMLQSRNPSVSFFAGMGLIVTALSAAGMFTMIAFTVVQRKREIGVRMAIGATPRQILSGLLHLHAKPLIGGIAKGTVGSVILLLFVRAMISPEPYIELLSGLLLGLVFFSVVAALSTLVPALRALRIDPSEALRSE